MLNLAGDKLTVNIMKIVYSATLTEDGLISAYHQFIVQQVPETLNKLRFVWHFSRGIDC